MKASRFPLLQQPQRLQGDRSNEQGFALVFVLLSISVLSVLAMTYLLDTTIEAKVVAVSRDHHLALYSAEAGIQEALVRLNTHDRTLTQQVNGSDVRVWIPYDTKVGEEALGTPKKWRFVHDDGVNNDGASGSVNAPGLDSTADDWAEYDPSWQANIWYASQETVDLNLGSAAGNHYATLVDFTQSKTDGLLRQLLEHSVAPDHANVNQGLQMRWKRDAAGSMLFTDGAEQFTAQQGREQLHVQEAWPVVEIQATGKFGRANRRLLGEAANFPVHLPKTAVYSCGETIPTFVGNGNMTVSGLDYPLHDPQTGQPAGQGLNGAAIYEPPLDPTVYPPVPALTVCCPQGPGHCTDPSDESEAIQDEIQGNAELYGSDTGDGDSIQIGETNIRSLFEAYSYYLTPGHDYLASNVGELGNADTFYVSRIQATGGTNVVHGDGLAGGVLLIDTGDDPGNVVRFNADMTMYGLVLAVGKGELAFNGAFRIFGSIIAGSEVVIRGTAQVYYCSEAITKVQRLQAYRLVRLYEPHF